jgi:mono/diheme cytochrome c family protein
MKTLQIRIGWFLAALASAIGESPVHRAPAKTATTMNPFEGNDKARRAGAKLYERECAQCHGSNGQGGKRAPSLNEVEIAQTSPGVLFWVLRNGSLRRGMPSFAHLPEQERWQIITFLGR